MLTISLLLKGEVIEPEPAHISGTEMPSECDANVAKVVVQGTVSISCVTLFIDYTMCPGN